MDIQELRAAILKTEADLKWDNMRLANWKEGEPCFLTYTQKVNAHETALAALRSELSIALATTEWAIPSDDAIALLKESILPELNNRAFIAGYKTEAPCQVRFLTNTITEKLRLKELAITKAEKAVFELSATHAMTELGALLQKRLTFEIVAEYVDFRCYHAARCGRTFEGAKPVEDMLDIWTLAFIYRDELAAKTAAKADELRCVAAQFFYQQEARQSVAA